MTPSRRKGAGKAAAAAAARRRWNVGDLVLAKVKGFPAWPSTVSEPEKWGYATDWKKVFVYFFGTQQIGFCNPADVEAFTEEKKESLLVKHQGKGADFVRSVQEIIDSYEKSKKKDQSDVINSGNEATQTIGGSSTDSSTMNVLKAEAEVSVETLDSRLNASNSARDRSDSSAEDAVKQIDSLLEKENLQEKPNESVEETPLLAAYTSRKRSGGSRQQNSVAQRRAAPIRRSRSSSSVEPAWFQNFVMPPSDEAANGVRDRSRRNKRIRKSPEDISDFNDGGSTALASNVSPVESEIVTIESDSLSPNEGRSVDSVCKLELPETVKYLERDLELSKGLDLQIQAVVIRKKRKPNREAGMIEAMERIAIPDKEAGLEGGVNDTGQISQYICEKANERNSKEDGDEHLPLVKRARVRMSKPVLETIASASSVEELNSRSQEDKLFNEGAVGSAGQINTALNCDSKGTTERISFLVKGTSDITSPSKDCTPSSGKWGHLLKVYKNQSSGCFADGEAALPHSKRLNRVLEAMSANVAEEGQAIIEASLTSKTSINGCCVYPMSRCPDTAVQSREGKGLGQENVDCSAKNNSHIGFICSNATSSPETTSSVGVRAFDKPTKDVKRVKQNFDKDFAAETMDIVDGSDLIAPSAGTVQTVVSIENPGSLLPDLVIGQANSTSNQGSSDQLLPTNDEGGSEDIELINCRAENSDKECVTSEHTRLCPDIVQGVGKVAKVSPGDDTILQHCRSDGTGCENIESLKSQVDENCQVNGMCEGVSDKEELKEGQKDRSYASVSSDDRLSDKVTSDVQSSPCPIDGVDSPTRVPSPSTLTCHISTSESANFPKSNGYSSPSLLLDQNKSFVIRVADEEKSEPVVTRRPKFYSMWNNYAEAQSALSSFEAILGTLTGKKESIGRATRTAINCGKWGVAAKVVEVLARNLESESSLHRRVDMFFLVDSITQCSQNMKGDVGGMYLSAIQSLLPRLLSAAAPPGSTAQENRRQCLKVLRVWLDRRILPESVVRYHIRELDSHSVAFSAGAYSRRSLRTERSLDDPVREMDAMHVDEYGSNSSFQLPGFCMPRMLKDEGEVSDSDEEIFEAVTPEHKPDTPEERETTRVTEKHRHILEDVDGELEMEDVAPSCDVEMNAGSAVAGVSSSQSSHDRVDLHFPRSFAPPPLRYVLPSSLPPPPPPPSLPPQRTVSNSYSASHLRSGTNNMQDDSRQPVEQHSVAPRMNRTSDAARYHAPECRDHHMHRPIPDCACTFGSFSGRPANNVRHNDGARFHSKPYPPRPPHLAPSDQFSYIQVEHRVKSRREVPPPPFHNKFHGTQNMGGGIFHSNLDRFKPPPYEYESCENWRFHGPSFSGPRYPIKGKTYYPHDPYTGPSREPTRLQNQGWSYPPRDVHHRNSMPIRHPYEAPNFWRRR